MGLDVKSVNALNKIMEKWDCLFITAIELYENGGELFGWSWAKKATEEKQVAIETKVTE